MKRKILYIIFIAIALTSCGEFTKIQKSTDPEVKLAAAKNYFQEKQYMKASTLLSDVMDFYRGTGKSQEVLYLMAESYMGQKDYFDASEYYQSYLKAFPRGTYAEESRFKLGYCYYLQSPDARLDQTETHEAINALKEYLQIYPNGTYADKAYKYLDNMKDKLAYKGYLNAKLYFNLGLYMGNNYESAIITAQNTLKEYPDTKYREDLSFLILKSKYQEAVNSVAAKKSNRFSDVVDDYYRYTNEFPNGKNIDDANKMLKQAKRYIKE